MCVYNESSSVYSLKRSSFFLGDYGLMEEVDEGCSELCVTVGTVARNASILIHSRLKALAVNVSWPSGRLWLYAGLTGSNNPRWLKADLLPHGCEWVNVSSGTDPTWVVLDKVPLYSCTHASVCVT